MGLEQPGLGEGVHASSRGLELDDFKGPSKPNNYMILRFYEHVLCYMLHPLLISCFFFIDISVLELSMQNVDTNSFLWNYT